MLQPKTKTPRPILAPNDVFWGDRLQLAREFRGLTQEKLAEAVAASPTLVRYCESGKKREPVSDLVEAFGTVLGFEPEFFYGPLNDVFREDECSFRHRRTTPQKTKTQVRAHATLIAMVVEKLRGVFRFPKLDVPVMRASSSEEIETAAERCRVHWNLGLDGPLLHVGRAAEHAGIFVVPHLAQSEKVDAFSRRGKTTIIFLNQAVESSSRWNFDIAHECGHIVMHQKIVTGDIETETAADRFASAFLMPRRAFEREFRSNAFSWTFIFELKRRWQTSAAAIIHRAYDLHLIDAVTYRRSYQYMSAQGWRTKGEPYEPAFQQPELLVMALSSLGKKVDLTMEELRSELHFTDRTFQEVTGMAIPASSPQRKAEVLQFKPK
jgi:Zn-dependent peptidase ImmA (M78 family)/transcriptional regulator with XRE-family HTH domain